MKKILIMIVIALAVLATQSARAAELRVLSLAPVATEILYYLGLGDSVVGVTKYCDWPPEAREKPQLPDMMNVSVEAVASFAPDVVALASVNSRLAPAIEAMGHKTVIAEQESLADIERSIVEIGRACGIPGQAALRAAEMMSRVEALRRPSGSDRVLVVVGRDTSDPTMRSLYVAGDASFYLELIRDAGGDLARSGSYGYSKISREGLIALDPDVIIELVNCDDETAAKIRGDWLALDDVRAAREGRISILNDTIVFRPGPRYPQLISIFADAIR